jgi:hypothetical protein
MAFAAFSVSLCENIGTNQQISFRHSVSSTKRFRKTIRSEKSSNANELQRNSTINNRIFIKDFFNADEIESRKKCLDDANFKLGEPFK